MPTSVLDEVNDLLDTAEARRHDQQPEYALRFSCPSGEGSVRCHSAALLQCPACGSAHVAQVLGDNGGISYVCTACGHSWS